MISGSRLARRIFHGRIADWANEAIYGNRNHFVDFYTGLAEQMLELQPQCNSVVINVVINPSRNLRRSISSWAAGLVYHTSTQQQSNYGPQEFSTTKKLARLAFAEINSALSVPR